MAYSAPSTRSSGDTLTAAIWNADVKDNEVAINAGAVAIASQAAGDVITASSSTQLARTPNISVAQGGTGLTTLTLNSLLIGAGTSDVTFAAPSTSGNVLTSNGTVWASAAPAGGDVAKVGTPVNNELAVWTGDGTLEGESELTYDGTTLTVTGGQIAFPATQVPSTGANTLDDYEEGTWTPVIGGAGGTSGQSYGYQVGTYVKIGKIVVIRGRAILSTEGTITGTATIAGLPFTVENNGNIGSANVIFSALATSWVNVGLRTEPGVTYFELRGNTAAATSNLTSLTATDIGSTTDLTFTVVYIATT